MNNLTKREQETTLMITIMNMEDEMRSEGIRLANEIDKYSNPPYNEEEKRLYSDYPINHFKETLEYTRQKINFIADIATALGLTTHIKLVEDLNCDNIEELADNFTPINFCWEQKRFYNEKETEERSKRRNEIIMKMIEELRRNDDEEN
jgi:hypothetical protein